MPEGSTTSLYILIRYNTKYKVYRDWFCIDPKGIKFNSSCQQQFDEFGKQTKFLNKPLFSMPSDMPNNVTCVAIGSKIYSLGGYDPTSYISNPRIYNKAYVYDTADTAAAQDTTTNNNKKTLEWERIPSMLLPRSGPSALVLDEKLIVMGSDCLSNWTRGIPWSEVYDPINNTWSTFINQPPSDLILATISQTCVPSVECLFVATQSVDHTPNMNMFLIYFEATRKTFFYCPKLVSWKEVYLPFELNFPFSNCAVVVQQVIFMVTSECLYAYDLVEGGLLHDNYKLPNKYPDPKIVNGLENDYPSDKHRQRSFFHLGNMDFCLVWACVDLDTHYVHTIHCLRFHIDREDDGEWLASVLSHDLYDVPVPDGCGNSYIEHCVQVRS